MKRPVLSLAHISVVLMLLIMVTIAVAVGFYFDYHKAPSYITFGIPSVIVIIPALFLKRLIKIW